MYKRILELLELAAEQGLDLSLTAGAARLAASQRER